MFTNDCTTRHQRISFTRVLVEMDITIYLSDRVLIEDEWGNEFKQEVTYDWRPGFCKKCSMLGHDCFVPIRRTKTVESKRPEPKQIWVPKK